MPLIPTKNIVQKGFSLIELSMVLVIMGITASGALSVAISKTQEERIEITEARLDGIEEALAEYVRVNAALPCTASGTQAIDDGASNFGMWSAVAVAPGTSVDCLDGYGSAGGAQAGVVPIRNLGLPDEYLFDGWGRRINYIVDETFATNISYNNQCNGTTSTLCFKYTTNGAISVGSSAGGSDRTANAIYVLISHGPNGYGAYPRNGAATRLTTASMDADEQENAHVSAAGATTAFDKEFVQKESTTTFDDIVRYKIKSDLVSAIASPKSESICDMAENVVNNPDLAADLTCYDSSAGNSIDACQLMAAEIDKVCAGLYN